MVRAMTDDQNISENDEPAKERIAKALARAGVGSRRDVERMIAEGRIALNGETLQTPAVLVDTLAGITVDGEKIGEVTETKLWRMHKRKGVLTTHKDPEGRSTVFDNLPKRLGRVISIGRLDMNTEGLLLLTNDGELARWLELPKNQVVRRYRVRAFGRVDGRKLKKLKDGITIDGVHYGEIDAALEKIPAEDAKPVTNHWIKIAIREGKNREVRKVMEHLGLTVNRLIRTHYGPFTLGTLPSEAVVEVPDKQLRDVLSDFFESDSGSVVAPKLKRDSSKWAKAKPKDKVKPGYKRRAKFKAAQAKGESTPGTDKKQDRQNKGKGKPSQGNSRGKPAVKDSATAKNKRS